MIENEIKIVLTLDAANHISEYPDFLYPFIRKSITQGYHQHGGRLRRESVRQTHDRYTFNYKIPLSDGQWEEFEQIITGDSYNRSIDHCHIILTKIRYTTIEDEDRWDVDFFTHEDEIYFCMAECEMPEGHQWPTSLPPFIDRFQWYNVPRGDLRFSSKMLADQNYTMELMDDIFKAD